ncbi:endonuclease domain-containing protein, partial [Escherichia coli]|uniref:endonuclease domain-containing protein n=1 Tax=Escherichia coli TaxID=562 RepID=UPI003D36FDE0
SPLRPEVAIARKLRRDLSLPEALLWQRLRGRQAGLKFRRQHPVGPYVVDFYCPAVKTVIEIDGQAHDRADRPDRDAARESFIAENGLHM